MRWLQFHVLCIDLYKLRLWLVLYRYETDWSFRSNREIELPRAATNLPPVLPSGTPSQRLCLGLPSVLGPSSSCPLLAYLDPSVRPLFVVVPLNLV